MTATLVTCWTDVEVYELIYASMAVGFLIGFLLAKVWK